MEAREVHGLRRVIAVIDDDASVRRALFRLLRTAAFDVSLFTTAEEYLAVSDHLAFDCLVVDVRLPGMCGLQLLERLQRSESRRPTLVITAHGEEQVRDRALAAGAIGFFHKPCDNHLLLAAIHQAIGHSDRET